MKFMKKSIPVYYMPKIRLSNKLFRVCIYTLLHTYGTTQTSFFFQLDRQENVGKYKKLLLEIGRSKSWHEFLWVSFVLHPTNKHKIADDIEINVVHLIRAFCIDLVEIWRNQSICYTISIKKMLHKSNNSEVNSKRKFLNQFAKS